MGGHTFGIKKDTRVVHQFRPRIHLNVPYRTDGFFREKEAQHRFYPTLPPDQIVVKQSERWG
jgi:hypothetical protein